MIAKKVIKISKYHQVLFKYIFVYQVEDSAQIEG